jgi:hypothetical protein
MVADCEQYNAEGRWFFDRKLSGIDGTYNFQKFDNAFMISKRFGCNIDLMGWISKDTVESNFD